MKKLKLFFALFAILALGVGNAWAEDYSIKFLTAATDGSTEIATSTKTSTVLESASCAYVTGFTSNCTKAYYKGKSGVKLSSKNAAGTIELTLSNTCNQNISKVVFKTVKYSSDASTLTFYAGTSTLGTIAAGSDFSHTFTTPQSVSTLKIESSKRAYISEIIISVSAGETPGEGEEPTPDPEDPTPGTGTDGETVTYVFKDDSNCPGNDQTWFNGTIDEFSGWTATKGTNDPKYYDTGEGLRVYNGGTFTITSTKVMTSITLTFAGTSYTFSTSNTTNPQTVTPNAKAYEWSVGRTCRLQKIEITYAADAGGSEQPVDSLTAK